MLHLLEEKFTKSGFNYNQVFQSKDFYVYEISYIDAHAFCYEIIRRTQSKVCVDFKNRVYSDTDTKETYPSSEQWGKKGWTIRYEEKAIDFAKEKQRDIDESRAHPPG